MVFTCLEFNCSRFGNGILRLITIFTKNSVFLIFMCFIELSYIYIYSLKKYCSIKRTLNSIVALLFEKKNVNIYSQGERICKKNNGSLVSFASGFVIQVT